MADLTAVRPTGCHNPPGRIDYPSGVVTPPAFPASDGQLTQDIVWLEKAALLEELVNDFIDWAMSLDPNGPASNALNQSDFNPFFNFLVSSPTSPLPHDVKTRLRTLTDDTSTSTTAFRTALDEFVRRAAPTPEWLGKAGLIEELVNDFIDWAVSLDPNGPASNALNQSDFNPFFNFLKTDTTSLSQEARNHIPNEESDDQRTMWRSMLAAWQTEARRRRLPAAPTGLAAASVTATSATFSWTAPTPPPASYILLHAAQAATTATEVNTGTAVTGNVTGLQPATDYDFAVVAQNDVGCGPVSAVQTFQTLPNTPGAVTNLEVVEPTMPNSVRVKFGSPAAAPGTATPGNYLIDWRVSGGVWSPPPIEVSHVAGQAEYEVDIPNLDEETYYEIRVRAQTNSIGPERTVTARTTSSTEGLSLLKRWDFRIPNRGGWRLLRAVAPEDLQLRFGEAVRFTGDRALIPPSGPDANGGYGLFLRWSTSNDIGEDTGLPQGLTAAIRYQRDEKGAALFSGGSTWNRTQEVNGALAVDNSKLPFVLAAAYSKFEVGTVSPFGLNPHPLRRNWFNTDSGNEFSAVLRLYPRALEHRWAGIPREWLRSFVELNYRQSNADRDAGPELPYEGLSNTLRSEGHYWILRGGVDTEFGHNGGWRAGIGGYHSLAGQLSLGGQRLRGGSTSTGFESPGGVQSTSTSSDSTAWGLEGSIGYGDLEVTGRVATEENGKFEDTGSWDVSASFPVLNNRAAGGAQFAFTVAGGETWRNLRAPERVREQNLTLGLEWGLSTRGTDGWLRVDVELGGGMYSLDSRFGNETGGLAYLTFTGTFGTDQQAEATNNLRSILQRQLP